jgi:hypothetical protein
MENHSLASANCSDCRAVTCHSRDDELLDAFSTRLIADDVPWRERSGVLATAAQFLHWWRKQYVGESYEIRATGGNRPSHDSEWTNLRETYLRETCPDHALRPDERSCLNRFLRFINGSTSVARCVPASH